MPDAGHDGHLPEHPLFQQQIGPHQKRRHAARQQEAAENIVLMGQQDSPHDFREKTGQQRDNPQMVSHGQGIRGRG